MTPKTNKRNNVDKLPSDIYIYIHIFIVMNILPSFFNIWHFIFRRGARWKCPLFEILIPELYSWPRRQLKMPRRFLNSASYEHFFNTKVQNSEFGHDSGRILNLASYQYFFNTKYKNSKIETRQRQRPNFEFS